MKSTTALFGAKKLATLCEQLEHASATGTLAGAEARIAGIEAAYAEVAHALQRFIAPTNAQVSVTA